MSERLLVILAGLNMFIAVAAGAFGAHGLKRILDPDMLAVWQTAVTYHLAHALGMFAVALLMPRFDAAILGWAGGVMFTGIVIFSGSLYLLALTGIRLLGAITPVGGIALLASWLLVAWSGCKTQSL
ncbi:MAG: DUF423 domain-containing protein [Herbaspirillum sp.]